MISDEDPALGAFSVQILSKVGAHLPEAVCKAPAKPQAAVPHLFEVAESGPPKASKAAVRYAAGLDGHAFCIMSVMLDFEGAFQAHPAVLPVRALNIWRIREDRQPRMYASRPAAAALIHAEMLAERLWQS